MKRVLIVSLGMVLCISLAASAQENRSEISLQGTGLFTSSTTGNGTDYSATSSGGFLGTYRYHLNHWISLEGAYGYSVNTQKYSLSSSAFRIQSGVHDFTGSLVMNLPSRSHSRINPYLLIGGGALRFAPTSNQFNTVSDAQGQTKGAFVYGVGVNYAIYKSLSLRAEYRGLIYNSPTYDLIGLAGADRVTHRAEPSIGFGYRF